MEWRGQIVVQNLSGAVAVLIHISMLVQHARNRGHVSKSPETEEGETEDQQAVDCR